MGWFKAEIRGARQPRVNHPQRKEKGKSKDTYFVFKFNFKVKQFIKSKSVFNIPNGRKYDKCY